MPDITKTGKETAGMDLKKTADISAELTAAVLEISIKIDETDDFKAAMQDVTKDIRYLCGAERCCVFLTDAKEKTCTVFCEDTAADAPEQKPMAEMADDRFYTLAQSWEEAFGAGSLILQTEEEIGQLKEKSPAWFRELMADHIRSMLLIPLHFRGKQLGYVWAANFDPDSVRERQKGLELICFIIGSELSSYLLLDRLRILSSQDLLTGVMNRNEMNSYVERLSCGEEGAGRPAGVIFADLNGLKYVNDLEGHPAGDELLRNAARSLLEVFDRDTIFRAGGDEFTMIILDVKETDLEEKADELRRVMGRYDKVSFAIGCHAVPDARDVRTALRIADERMYVDKEKFYQSDPEIMRKKNTV